MKALPGSVVDFTEHAATRATQLYIAKQRHPAMRAQLLNAGLPQIDRARALTALAREWTNLVDDLSSGPDSLSEDEAEATLQVALAGLVHPHAKPGLVFHLPQLRQAVTRRDQMRDGILEPLDVGCHTTEAAVAECDDEIDALLWPLLAGLPLRDACRGCRSSCASVNQWQTQVACDRHDERRL